MSWPRLGVRTRLLLAAVGAVAVALVIGVAAFNIVLGQRLSDSAVSLARGQATAALSSLLSESDSRLSAALTPKASCRRSLRHSSITGASAFTLALTNAAYCEAASFS